MATETCRDVLADMLADIEEGSFLESIISRDRIRAAIAADDAELSRLRRIEEAARDVDDALGSLLRAGCSVVAHNAPPEIGNAIAGALASLSVALLPPTMRQIEAAQRIAGEMPELRQRHARAAVDGGRDDG